MTTILVDFENKKVVADRRITSIWKSGIHTLEGTRNKLSIKEKTVVTGTGLVSFVEECQKKYCSDSGIPVPSGDGTTIAVVGVDFQGDLFVEIYEPVRAGKSRIAKWLGYPSSWGWRRVVHKGLKYLAMGSGGSAAEVLFLNGFTAEQSVLGAGKVDRGTGDGIDVVRYDKFLDKWVEDQS